MVSKIKQFIADEAASSGAEYVILAALIAAVIVASVTIFGGRVDFTFKKIEGVYPGK